MDERTEWTGSPDPADPDNFWIDDDTGERVNAETGERTAATAKTLALREAEERHFADEERYSGSGAVNEHPDGCFYCGSGMHRSDSCSSQEREDYYR